jgi:general secretion pathway protein C
LAAAQLTDRLTVLLNQLGSWLKALPFKTVYKCLIGLLVLWIVVSLLQLLFAFIPSSSVNEDSVPAKVAESPMATSVAVDIEKLQAIPLFGESGGLASNEVEPLPVQDEVVLNATKTRLNLILEGIVHTPEVSDSVAVIVYQGKQDQYYVGDKLPVGNRVELVKVLVDHVILDNAGNYESLWLYDDEKKNSRASITGQRVTPQAKPVNNNKEIITDNRKNEEATNLASDYRQRLYKNPSSLAEVLRIAPAQNNGQLVGYKVSPGRDREQFAQLGFKANDIVTSINGIALDEPSKALQVYKLMRTAKEASFTVERDSQLVEVMVSLGEDSDDD